jgi:hypothetical protein
MQKYDETLCVYTPLEYLFQLCYSFNQRGRCALDHVLQAGVPLLLYTDINLY